MDSNLIIYSTSLLCGLGVIVSIGLSFAAKKFKVEINPLIEKVANILPGTNCGSCGYAGCELYAKAIVEQNAEITLCKPGGQTTVDKISEILGRRTEKLIRKIAVVMCNGGTRCKDLFVYTGVKKCSYVTKYYDGHKMCAYGCLGFGDCIEVCPFDAIFINEYGVAEVDILKCTGCGLCVDVCPKKIIKLVPCNFKVHIKCNSLDKGSVVRQICSVGCIGCGVCVKVCPVKDIYLNKTLAVMKYDRCDNCQLCVEKCPTKCIYFKKENVLSIEK